MRSCEGGEGETVFVCLCLCFFECTIEARSAGRVLGFGGQLKPADLLVNPDLSALLQEVADMPRIADKV